jgi:hypothetical protein
VVLDFAKPAQQSEAVLVETDLRFRFREAGATIRSGVFNIGLCLDFANATQQSQRLCERCSAGAAGRARR